MINDMRISVERPFLRDWNLHIRNVSITDAGEFLCQLNTDPVKSKQVNLLVNGESIVPEAKELVCFSARRSKDKFCLKVSPRAHLHVVGMMLRFMSLT